MATIISAVRADYSAIQRYLENAYNHGQDFFPQHYPWCWREENTDYAHIYLIREGTPIASLVRVFPLELALGGAHLRVGGIGGVSTDPACRGKGYMTELLNHAIARMKAEKFPLSILWGDQHRYQSFGYQTGGKAVIVTVAPRGLEKTHVQPLTPVRFQGQARLLVPMVRAYQAQPFHRVRTEEEFRLACTHPDLRLFCAGEDDKFAYVGLMHDTVAECGGDTQTILRMTSGLMTGLGHGSLKFCFPQWDLIPKALLAAASDWSMVPTGQIKILDLTQTLACFRPQAPHATVPTLEKLHAQSDAEQVEALFGTAHHSPFNIMVWPLDQI